MGCREYAFDWKKFGGLADRLSIWLEWLGGGRTGRKAGRLDTGRLVRLKLWRLGVNRESLQARGVFVGIHPAKTG